jgi:hypothetical protein
VIERSEKIFFFGEGGGGDGVSRSGYSPIGSGWFVGKSISYF